MRMNRTVGTMKKLLYDYAERKVKSELGEEFYNHRRRYLKRRIRRMTNNILQHLLEENTSFVEDLKDKEIMNEV